MAYPGTLRIPESGLPGLLLKHYRIRGVVEHIRHGYRSTTVRFASSGGRYMLKALISGDSGQRAIERALSASRRLSSAGIPAAESVPAISGADTVTESGNTFVLWRYLDGNPFQPGNVRQLADAGSVLGRIHRIRMADDRSAEVGAGSAGTLALEGPIGLCGRASCGAVTLPYGWQDFLQAATSVLADQVTRVDGLPHTFNHGDYRAQNLLFEGDRVSAVLDTEDAAVGPRMLDAAYAATFFQAVVAEGPMSVDDRSAFWAAYEGQVRLSVEELAARTVCLLLAYLKGVSLWLRIACVDRPNDEALGWLAAYRPLGEELLSLQR